MHILIAPDKFKGTLSAAQAAAAIATGLHRSLPHATLDLCPLSDGGEGMLELLAGVNRAQKRTALTVGALGAPLLAPWLLLQDGTAVLESAAVLALALLGTSPPDPTLATSYGLGLVIREAISRGAQRLLIGLGGTATMDGGTGLLRALTASPTTALDADLARRLQAGMGGLYDLQHQVPKTVLHPRVPVIALCDVENLLLGETGAARVYAPQKGATPAQTHVLECALEAWHRRWFETGLELPPHVPGDGAAGGLGFALRVGLGATLLPGGPYLIEAVNLEARMAAADLVVTGEGCIDAQTLHGKLVARVAAAANQRGVPVVALGGQVKPLPPGLEWPFAALAAQPSAKPPLSHDEPARALENAAQALGQGIGSGDAALYY